MERDTAELVQEIVGTLVTLPNLNTARLRQERRLISRRIAKSPPDTVVELARRLAELPGFGHRFLGYELVHHHREALASLRARHLQLLGRGLDSWGAVDMFACYLSGPAWREGQVPDSLIYRWARSPNRWWRRAALVSTVPLNNKARGGDGDTKRTLAVCRLLIADRDDMVVKALSWALRELAKRDPDAVRKFMSKNRNRIAARVGREVNNKLTTGVKNPPRHGRQARALGSAR